MSELGSSAAVGIESVEWLDAGGGQLTVRVTGRWRRRRGWVESRGPTMLVVESEGRRNRFPATPEPPSLGGAAPGTWRLSFTVPAEFAHGLGGHVWLALGTVTVPLPVPESAAGPAAGQEAVTEAKAEPASADAAPSDAPSERDPGRLEIERAWRRADAAERTAGELGERVTALERALERERAERALQPEHRQPADPAGAERERLRAEDALRAARRGAGARVPAEPPSPVVDPSLAPAVITPPPPAGAEPEPVAGEPIADRGRPGELDTISALRRELGARVAAEAALRARTVQAETRLAARVLLEQRTTIALDELRTELEHLRHALERERDGRRAAETAAAQLRAELGGQRERSRDAHAAIQELRSAIEQLRPPAPSTPAGEAAGDDATRAAAGAVTPDRLSDALTRLRQNAEPRVEPADSEAAGQSPAAPATSTEVTKTPSRPAGLVVPASAPAPLPVGVAGPTVEEPFRRLAGRDAERAGRLLIGLLGAQGAAWPHGVAYDLVLGPGYGTVQVTVGERGVSVERAGAARAREQVAFQIDGGPARLARLFTAGPLRRALRIGVARVRGRREGMGVLRALLALPLDLGALRTAGVAPDGETMFTLLAAMIEPTWTRGERFTISHTDERGHAVFLQILDGQPPLVSLEPPAGRIATELDGPGEELWRAFADGASKLPGGAGVVVRGDQGPLTLVRTWANRAQSGHGAR
ncbi:MAG TPA: hypothetical protein VMF07_03270 [Solirubrobacteraceae bacterium]|nr:hypothetical protein [Solirubrobacteraceae bacterium]